MPYKVLAPQVNAKDHEGHLRAHFPGQIIAWLNDAERHRFLRLKHVEEIGEPAQQHPVDSAVTPTPPGSGERPPQVAPKDAWVTYAVAQGYSQAEADAMTKQDLIAALS